PFFTTKELGKGTGLGLSTVYGIVQQHHGFITIDSKPSVGTTFEVFLPLLTPEAEPRTALTPRAAAQGDGQRVLLVEDEPAVRAVAECILETHGYVLTLAENGIRALDAFAAHEQDINLLLTDVVMPGGLSGIELAERLCTQKPG